MIKEQILARIAEPLPTPAALLETTNWDALTAFWSDPPQLRRVLGDLLHPDAQMRFKALYWDLEPIRHQDSVYPPAFHVACYLAAILPDPRTAALGRPCLPGSDDLPSVRHRPERPRPLRAAMLDWIGFLTLDAADSRDDNPDAAPLEFYLGAECEDDRFMWDLHAWVAAVDALRPRLFPAVSAFWHDPDPEVRHASVVASLPLVQHPAIAQQWQLLCPLVVRLLREVTDPQDGFYRVRGLAALSQHGYDPSHLRLSIDEDAEQEWFLWSTPEIRTRHYSAPPGI